MANRRRGGQEGQAQSNVRERRLETVQNPYYGVYDTEIDIGTIQINENPYYEM